MYVILIEDANKAKLQELEDKISDAEKNQGETEIRDAMLAKAEHLCRVGEKDDALTAFRSAGFGGVLTLHPDEA